MLRENEYTEFKKTTSELHEAMISISAILNKHREGTIYFGLKNDGTPYRFTITDSTLRDISRKIYESIRPQLYPEINTVVIDGVEVIKVGFSGQDIPYSAFGKYYIRVADEDRELSPKELRNIMIGKEYEENWENRSSTDTIDDVDEKTLDKFYLLATSCGRLPDIGKDKELLLSKLGVLNGSHLTNAGKFLFSKNKPITLKMAVFATNHKTTFLDIVREEGNIFQLIDVAMSYVIKNIRWKVQLNEDGIHRNEIPEIPIDALREAIINSFVHARYDSFVQHEIDIYSNRVSIINPGSFANEFQPIDFVSRDLHSYLRNEIIAKTLYLCKDVETFGSGLRKIYSLCESNNIDITYQNNETDFTFEFSRIDRNYNYDEIKDDTLSKLESFVLSLLKKEPNLTIQDLVSKTNKSTRTINRCLSSLKTRGLLRRIGSNKTGFWKVK